ncbi:MAG: universal stress protein [Rhodospirillaceae bacterium]
MDKFVKKKADRFFLVVVDDSEELRVALRFASQRAHKTGGRVALLSVLEPADFQHWMAVEERMRAERREDAERLLEKLGGEVKEITGEVPALYVREGVISNEIIRLIKEEPQISILVLGAGKDKKGPGPLVTSLAGKLSGEFPIPITVVPGTLSDKEIDDLT